MINLKNFKYHFFHRLTSSKNSAHSASNGTYVAPIDSRRLFSSSNGSTVDRKPMSNLNRNNESSAAANGSKSSSTRSLNRTGNGSVIGSGGGSNRVGTPNAVRRSTATLGNDHSRKSVHWKPDITLQLYKRRRKILENSSLQAETHPESFSFSFQLFL